MSSMPIPNFSLIRDFLIPRTDGGGGLGECLKVQRGEIK